MNQDYRQRMTGRNARMSYKMRGIIIVVGLATSERAP
jgi:hypothetical protein